MLLIYFITSNRMPYKQKIRTQLKKAISRFNNSAQQADEDEKIHKKFRTKKRFKPAVNYYQKKLILSPVIERHVFNFYNIIGINQRAIRDPQHDESHFKTIFYYNNLQKIEIQDKYLMFSLKNSGVVATSVAYMINRFKSFGNQKFYQIACLIEELDQSLKMTNAISKNSHENKDDFTTFLNSLGSTPFVCKISSNRLAISKTLLDLLQYNAEEFAIECLKFKVPVIDGMSCERYFDVIIQCLSNFKLLIEVLQGRIPLSSFVGASSISYTDSLHSKNEKIIHCKMTSGMPCPLITAITIDEVLSISDELSSNSKNCRSVLENKNKEIKSLKSHCEQKKEMEYQILKNLMKLPANVLPENKSQVANYQKIDNDN